MATRSIRRFTNRFLAFALPLLASCREQVVAPIVAEVPEAPGAGMKPLGLIEVRLNAIGTPDFDASAGAPEGISLNLVSPRNGGGSGDGSIQIERISTGSFTEGGRTDGGQRYFSATFRIRNAQSNRTAYDTPRTNLTLMAVRTASSLNHSAVSAITRFDGTAANPALAIQIIPTGAMVMNDSLRMQASYPDVIQVLTEAEAAAVPLEAGILEAFPWGFVVRNPNSASNRTLPANPAPSQFDGVVTFAFRVPLQPTAAQDPYNISFLFMAMDDSETRVTESIEEQDSASHIKARTRATALGATVSTVLDGSLAMDAAVADYPGQRQLCASRVAGPAGSPTSRMNAVGAYSRVAIFGPGQSLDPCAAYFRTGQFSPITGVTIGLNIKYGVQLRAMDRYGNTRTMVDTVTLFATDPTTTPLFPASLILAGGLATDTIRFASYGAGGFQLGVLAHSRRQNTRTIVRVAGVSRTWTAGASTTDWNTGGNWNVGAPPSALDSVVIPDVASGIYPSLTNNQSITGVTVDDTPGGSTPIIALNAFDLNASGDVLTTNNASITNSSGRLFLSGVARTVAGRVPVVRVTGTYSLTGNLTTRGPLQVDAGRITDGTYRLQVESN